MTPNEYLKLALVTEAKRFSNPSLMGRLSLKLFSYFHRGYLSEVLSRKRSVRLAHSLIGIATEMEELLKALQKEQLDLVNLMEETGDCFWYLALAFDEFETDFDTCFLGKTSRQGFVIDEHFKTEQKQELKKHFQESLSHSLLALDVLKKGLIYGKPLNEKLLLSELHKVTQALEDLCVWTGHSVSEAMTRNIKKLAKRYGQAFSSHFAYNRNLELEREILEGRSE